MTTKRKYAGVQGPTVSPDHQAWPKGSVTRRLCAALAQPLEPPQPRQEGGLGLGAAESRPEPREWALRCWCKELGE